MVTLFHAVSGGLSWSDAQKPLESVSPMFSTSLMVYVAFAYFCVLNGITGSFCVSAIESSMANPDLMTEIILARNRAYDLKLRDIFYRLDLDSSGVLTVTELERVMQDERLQALLVAMDIDSSDAWTLFWLLDENGNMQAVR